MNPCEICKGACCESIILPISFKDKDAQRWLDLHGERSEMGIRLDCKCKALVDGRCSIYDDRPEVCRVFEVGSAGCLLALNTRRDEETISRVLEAIGG